MHFFFQFGEFTAAEGGFWKTFLPLVAPMVALYIYYSTQKRTERKDKKSKIDTDNNKLRYLHYLVEDSLRPIVMFKSETNKLRNNHYNVNFFLMGRLDRIIPHSLNTIANKINQEEYYLASLNRIDEDISELFKVYNSLYDSIVQGVAHYDTNRPLLVQSKSDYNDALDELVKSHLQFINDVQMEGNNAIETIILPQVIGLLPVIPVEEDRRWNLIWMRSSPEIFTNRLIQILSQNQSPRSKGLLKECKNVNKKYNDYRNFSQNVVDALNECVTIQDNMVGIITNVRKPLDRHIEELDQEKEKYTTVQKTFLERFLDLFDLQRKADS